MAGSRLDRIGTIFSRTTGLIKAGGIKYQDRPLWYDIYRVFPPKYEPHIDREAEKKEVFEIMYHEDKYRALFFKKFGMNSGGIARNLGDRNSEDPSQTFVSICLKLKRENSEWSDNQVFDAAVESYKPSFSFGRADRNERLGDVVAELEASKRHGRKPPTISAQSLLSLFKEAKEKQSQSESESASKSNDKNADISGDNKQN